ncbi:kinetochore Sim4 complex subunit Fta4 [Paecilomyces variotii]|uniref:Kinetochore Sim4 complex subunit Fta4 n=1 Tax=Byssochlamys spectabilis TaxID=264951 RepID=A0A443HII6_BYSSP|nr:kinetochore Sim4 complex subunit Fta4 [Paecilomyces variotii]KAJ9254386.1 hypothetical protein DTO207G8_3577 [Paecilomyces variotii]KAJ9363731.1 hypothetical protein DTO280E4_2321 [Paecilomyces variotii]KAJ9386425.1 hypothetical protein DTO063F5_3688 [Paecilomyces variotii]RWQ91652.1 kinetochore Sim4 complex subunit Fta4 [Paecilomyces variotii]
MDTSRTISELKSSFVRTQVRILSAALEPQEGWRAYGVPSDEGDLSDKAVEEALQKLHSVLKQHNRVVYSSQAIHHVARQIESLYWNSVHEDLHGLGYHGKGVEQGTDLSNHLNISKLPLEWESESADEEGRQRYQQLRTRLVELDEQRQQQQRRLAEYKRLQALLEPFKDPQSNIQPNLVTRDGELGKELDRMRMLVARVAGRVSQSKSLRQEDTGNATYLDTEQKLSALLDMT